MDVSSLETFSAIGKEVPVLNGYAEAELLGAEGRDWFHPNTEKFFAFSTEPKLIVYMPSDSPEDYHQSDFAGYKMSCS